MRERCPYCTDKVEEVERRASSTGSFAFVRIRCTNPRCVFEMTDYDILPLSRPAGTPVTAENYSPLRWKRDNPEKVRASMRKAQAKRKARKAQA